MWLLLLLNPTASLAVCGARLAVCGAKQHRQPAKRLNKIASEEATEIYKIY
jgi:hypothetical protein